MDTVDDSDILAGVDPIHLLFTVFTLSMRVREN